MIEVKICKNTFQPEKGNLKQKYLDTVGVLNVHRCNKHIIIRFRMFHVRRFVSRRLFFDAHFFVLSSV